MTSDWTTDAVQAEIDYRRERLVTARRRAVSTTFESWWQHLAEARTRGRQQSRTDQVGSPTIQPHSV
ncbi:hypothetical protein [Allokutzneria oryzae]|uniref:Uncharacterized protein n=1 Tax=Allokutzneria oryzae TaxID=1378989 RepID=A0ABV6A8X7_9PSEU